MARVELAILGPPEPEFYSSRGQIILYRYLLSEVAN